MNPAVFQLSQLQTASASLCFIQALPSSASVSSFITFSASGKTIRSSRSKCLRDAVTACSNNRRASGKPPGGLHPQQAVVNFLMFVFKSVALANLFQIMIQRSEHQIFLGLAVGEQQAFHQFRPSFHLGQRFQFRQDVFNVVENVVEHDVFRQKCFGDFHVPESLHQET